MNNSEKIWYENGVFDEYTFTTVFNDHHRALYEDQNTPAAKTMIRQGWEYNHWSLA